MIGEKIKDLRLKQNLTQKELAEELFVTAQAISRWEKGEVEPSTETIMKLANIFNVSIDELFGNTTQQPVEEKKAFEYIEPKPVLGVCSQCNKPIYDGNEIVRLHKHHGEKIICKQCDEKNRNEKYERDVLVGKKLRKKSFIWSTIATLGVLAIVLVATITQKCSVGAIVGLGFCSLLFFPFVSCLILNNNFVKEMVATVFSWGFVKFPSLIFSLSLDGIVWLLTVKLLFWVLGIMIGLAFFGFAVCLGLIVSIFVYPFAIKKNFSNPEIHDSF